MSAVCALALTCASVPPARARQQDSTGAAETKPSTSKAATTKKPATSAPKHHTTASSSSASKKTASTTHAASTHTASTGKRSTHKKRPVRAKGQQKIDSERATAIQEALIREHYLNGEATGTWNQASEEAMRRYQADHGWQSKTVPDSRALIKLGLGPSKDHLLNPESAMTTGPDAPRAASMSTTSHSAPTTTGPTPVPTSSQNDPSGPQ